MAIQLIDVPFKVVPKELENKFILNVINNYMDCASLKKNWIVSEEEIGDEMLQHLNEIYSLQVFEDTLYYENLDEEHSFFNNAFNGYSDFMHDIVLTMERFKMCYQIKQGSFHNNLPHVKVW